MENLSGIVTKSTGNDYFVRLPDGRRVECKARGRFKIEGIKSTNPLAVGDHVVLQIAEGHKTGLIIDIEERKNYIIRKSKKLSKQYHVIAANLDQALLIVSLKDPMTPFGFIDRFLVTCEAYRIPVKIIVNKNDLNSSIPEKAARFKKIYTDAGYECHFISAFDEKDAVAFGNLLKGKTTLLSGNSGVGKSTLINAIEPDLNLKTTDLSRLYKKGRHTTTFAEMFELAIGAFVIDTPGIREFGLSEFSPEEITHFFPEMFRLLPHCRFHNCRHLQEPDCAVLRALEEEKISQTRYISYINIINNAEEDIEEEFD
ncbi:MAG: ribosome small subunit-dependent GTPase A [Bacteroidota bacterium]